MDENEINKLKSELVKVSKYFYSKGWMYGTSGNISALISKNPLTFLISESGKDKGEMTESDFFPVDEGGKSLIKNKIPSNETLIHSAIYKLTSASAVFHVHTVNSTLVSMNNSQLEFSGLEMLKGLGFKTHDIKVTIPIIENNQDIKFLSSILENYLTEIPAFLLKGHGIYAWGENISSCKNHLEVVEFLCEYKVKSLIR